MKIIILFMTIFSTQVFASSEATNDITSIENDINQKQQKAIALISILTNQRKSNLAEDEITYSKVGFEARLHGIREDRDYTMKKEIPGKEAILQSYSKRLDVLITDLHTFLK